MHLDAVEDGLVAAEALDDVPGFTAPDKHAAVVRPAIEGDNFGT